MYNYLTCLLFLTNMNNMKNNMNKEKTLRTILITALVICVIILFIIVCYLFSIIQNLSYINPKDYQVTIDKGTLTEDEYSIFLNILHCAESEINIVYYGNYENINQYKILTHLGMYFGLTNNLSNLMVWTSKEMFLNLDAFKKIQENKIIVDSKVEEALHHIKEGSDRYKLWQISKYIADRITYTHGVYGAVNGLNGEGTCGSYAMLFYKMASRIGIQTYICFGYDGYEKGFHAWNMVVVDDNRYFYDITWYDESYYNYNYKYIHSKTSWSRNFVLNDKWEGAKLNNE